MFLDFYSTDYAIRNMKCVIEMNPIYTDRPSTFELAFKKSLMIGFVNVNNFTKEEYDYVNGTYTLIVLNNLNVIKSGC
jgi:hypothetical protein